MPPTKFFAGSATVFKYECVMSVDIQMIYLESYVLYSSSERTILTWMKDEEENKDIFSYFCKWQFIFYFDVWIKNYPKIF